MTGVGVHRTWLRSFSLEPPQLVVLPIASARRAAAVPSVVLSSNRFAAGVRLPGASALRGVQPGGAMEALGSARDGVRPSSGVEPLNIPAFARRLFAALAESLWDNASRFDGAEIWNVFGGGTSSDTSSDWDITRGVAFKVPHVISCLTAFEPIWSAVGEGTSGTSEKPPVVGDFGRSAINKLEVGTSHERTYMVSLQWQRLFDSELDSEE